MKFPTEWKSHKIPSFQTTNQIYMDCNQPIPSGKGLHNYGKSPCSMGKITLKNGDFPYIYWDNSPMIPGFGHSEELAAQIDW